MMRAALFVVIIAVLALIGAIATGLLHFSTQPKIPPSAANTTGVAPQSRSFDVQTGSVHVGSRTTTVKVPRLEVKPPSDATSKQSGNGAESQ